MPKHQSLRDAEISVVISLRMLLRTCVHTITRKFIRLLVSWFCSPMFGHRYIPGASIRVDRDYVSLCQ